jgi:hypothetical protein
MARARLLRRLLLSLAGVCLAGCLSPTLPLPPPSRPDVSAPDESGYARLQGFAAPQVEVIALNRNNKQIAGQVTGDDSRYDFKIPAQSGDVLDLWYIDGDDESQTVVVKVPEPPAE